MRRTLCLALLTLAFAIPELHAQQETKTFGIEFSGFAKTDLIFDSRQTVNLREGHFLLYPAPELKSRDNRDINESPSFNMLSIQTRLHGKITGPDALGARTSGAVEGEFFGHSEGDINGFRLRHAFVELDWESSSLLLGQTWHPMFIAEMFPGVVSFNTGAPFQPFSRNPQVRFTQSFGGLKLMVAAASQRDFQSYGPDGTGKAVLSSAYLRNSVLPDMHVQAQFKSGEHLFGAGADYKILTPRLITSTSDKADESIGTMAAIAYAKIDLAPVTVKLEGVYGENLADLLMLGGYAVKSEDASTGAMEYTGIGCYSVWGELSYGKEVEVAVFAGYSQNLGAKDNITGTYYSRGITIDHLYRIAPRVQYTTGKVRFAAEVEYTGAAYGIAEDSNKGIVKDPVSVANTRVLGAVFYFF
ncbi:MAG: hypothetical protein M5R41_13905 [Bacteroidia bacterium]|nr:hypothetical protein [Bacteroidia bacterium]